MIQTSSYIATSLNKNQTIHNITHVMRYGSLITILIYLLVLHRTVALPMSSRCMYFDILRLGHSVSNHTKKLKFETVPPQILMKIYTFGLYGQNIRFAK